MESDLNLLRQYCTTGDAAAFRDLVQAHAGMVFAAARRVTRDPALAEDVAQETFLELARHGHEVTRSVAAWLHRAARRRACNAVRDARTRARYEARAAADRPPPAGDPDWVDLEPVIDAALDALPEKFREPLVRHYLEGHTQAEAAARLGVTQPTVSRLLGRGIERLRADLRRRGVPCGAGLAALLAANAAGAAPPAVVASLGKLALSGVGAGPGAAAAAPGKLAGLVKPAAVGAALLAAGALYLAAPDPVPPPARPAAPALPVAPAPVAVRGKAFCPMCAAPMLQGRWPAQGILIHRDGGVEVVYDLRLPGPVPDFHRRFCDASRKVADPVAAEGTPRTADGVRVFEATRIDLAPK